MLRINLDLSIYLNRFMNVGLLKFLTKMEIRRKGIWFFKSYQSFWNRQLLLE